MRITAICFAIVAVAVALQIKTSRDAHVKVCQAFDSAYRIEAAACDLKQDTDAEQDAVCYGDLDADEYVEYLGWGAECIGEYTQVNGTYDYRKDEKAAHWLPSDGQLRPVTVNNKRGW